MDVTVKTGLDEAGLVQIIPDFNVIVVRSATKVTRKVIEAGKTGGGSDASLAANLGLPTLDGLGPDGSGIHAEHEHILVPSFVERAALLTSLLAGLD